MLFVLYFLLALHSVFFVIHIRCRSARHPLLFFTQIAIWIMWAVLACLSLKDPGNDSFRFMILLSFFPGGLVTLINCLLLLKMNHLPLKVDAVCTAEEMRMRSAPFPVENNSYVVACGQLYILFPEYRRIEFYDRYEDFSREAAATASMAGPYHSSFYDHNGQTVLGSYISEGKYVKRPMIVEKMHLSAFVMDSDGFHFYPTDQADEAIQKAAEASNAVAFCNTLLIYHGAARKFESSYRSRQCFRVIAEYNGQLCLVEGRKKMHFESFRTKIERIGLTNALVLDMGTWNNVSWIRQSDNSLRYCFLKLLTRPGNQVVFYK